ncbi:hypothetical protein BGX28_000108 [Mortierella sp. GBA30]|nr:hypothetical protein BGX28_000108 [Mortierella sp. GBA30]
MANVPKLPFPTFQGSVVKRGDVGYEDHCYQYGSSSYETQGIAQPAAIIYAADDDDVVKVINYARANKITVAVRTGGHQYSCASSTFGKNIQLDLSNTYIDFTWDNADCTLVTLGISFSLSAVNARLGEKKRFVPHGQCSHVHLGGHVQTGGYGQLGRSFGLLADHVQKFRIITADGLPRWIRRGIPADNDLFFAVLGGSPGNFGVLTHVTLKVYKDEDHPQSRGLRANYLYSLDRLKGLLDLMVEMAENDAFPADYDYCITVLSSSCLVLPSFMPEVDDRMRRVHPELFGTDGELYWPPMIVVYAQWANLGGDGQLYDPTFFKRIKNAAGDDANPFMGIQVDDNEPTPMSTLTSHWIFQNVREFDLPYVKRTYMSNSRTLKEDRWTDWVCNRINHIQTNAFNECKLAVQIQHFGGSNSRTFQNRLDGTTAFSWRDSNICCVLDCFHCPDEAARATAEQWQVENDTEGVGHAGARFCAEDRRVLWGSHDLNLNVVHGHYYDDDPTKYERLCRIKHQFDPDGVFTPNAFCVGADRNNVRIEDRVHTDDRVMAPILMVRRRLQEKQLML